MVRLRFQGTRETILSLRVIKEHFLPIDTVKQNTEDFLKYISTQFILHNLLKLSITKVVPGGIFFTIEPTDRWTAEMHAGCGSLFKEFFDGEKAKLPVAVPGPPETLVKKAPNGKETKAIKQEKTEKVKAEAKAEAKVLVPPTKFDVTDD